jgi:hypothetical protein
MPVSRKALNELGRSVRDMSTAKSGRDLARSSEKVSQAAGKLYVSRDARTGRFVDRRTSDRHSDTTVRENRG